MTDLGRRFVTCFVAAADDARLPTDPAFRDALRASMEWAVEDVLDESLEASTVPAGVRMPHWDWDGLAASGPAAAGDVQHLPGDEPGTR